MAKEMATVKKTMAAAITKIKQHTLSPETPACYRPAFVLQGFQQLSTVNSPLFTSY
jgi:hypothetical protein